MARKKVTQILYAGKVGDADNKREPQLFAVREGGAEEALRGYFADVLKPNGYTKPRVSAGSLIVTNQFGNHKYIAREV